MNSQMPDLYAVVLRVEHQPGQKSWEQLTPYLRCSEQAAAEFSTIRQQFPQAELWTYKYRCERTMEGAQ